MGNEVKTLVNEKKPAGSYNVNFNAENLAAGLYVYQLRTENFVSSKKMMLLRKVIEPLPRHRSICAQTRWIFHRVFFWDVHQAL